MELRALLAIWIVLWVINYNLCRIATALENRGANKEMSVGGMAPTATRPQCRTQKARTK